MFLLVILNSIEHDGKDLVIAVITIRKENFGLLCFMLCGRSRMTGNYVNVYYI